MKSDDNDSPELIVKKPLRFNPWFLSVVLSAVAFIALDYILESYTSHPHRRDDRHSKTIDTLFRESAFSPEELKLAEKFEADTLPTLMRTGLIKQLKRNRHMTLVLVDRKRWSTQPRGLIVDVLTELLTNNRVRGYAAWTDVRDAESGKLIAGISLSGNVEIYE